MALHIVKLCVGCQSIEYLAAWIDFRLAEKRASDQKAEQEHITRMVPKRIDELLDGGSLYWVIKGNIQCRQKFIDIRPFTDVDGVQRCAFVLEPKIAPTFWQPRRAFQGWRYLKDDEVPKDESGGGYSDLPPDLRQELAALGLL